MISKRLRAIASLIDIKQSVVDIGCDHGYLALLLRQCGNEEKIICLDDKVEPLSSAQSNLADYDNIQFVLSDGAILLNTVVDVAVMAGMGYHTVQHILSDSEEYFAQIDKIIVQVNTDVDKMRKWLVDNGYKIVDEVIIKEYKYYQILVLEHGQQVLSEKQIQYGPVLLEKKDPTFAAYLQDQIKKNKTILDKIAENHPDRKLIENKINSLEATLSEVCGNS